MALETRSFCADRGDAGERLDRVLVRRLADRPEISRTQIQAWIAAGQVEVDGVAVRKPADRLGWRAEVTVRLPPPAPKRAPVAEEIALSVLYEDEHLLALDKPPGITVHPARGHAGGTLLNAVLWHFQQAGEAAATPHFVQRLDQGTSGVLLVAKRPALHAALAKALRAARAEKEYLALARGRPPRPEGRITWRIAPHPTDRRRRIASRDEGQESLTLYEVLGKAGGLCLLRCRLRTGRTHQIRVHLSAIGLPILGDPLYGTPSTELSRQALHAWKVRFLHPVTRTAIEIAAPLPADLAAVLAAAGLQA